MEYNEIIAELKSKLGDSPEENEKLLKAEGEKFAHAGDYTALKAVGELLMENMPAESKEELQRLTYLDGERLDKVYGRILKLINENKTLEALPLAEKLYKKIILDFGETETAKFVSLRNPFEDNLCQMLFKQEKKLSRTPFDFSAYITTYAYLLVETGANIDAIPILEKAISYNPVDVGPRFELAEIYKIIRNKKMVLQVTRDTLEIASSPVAIARCYANVGYALVDSGEYEDAAVFYTVSAMFAPNPAIPHELRHVADLKGSPVVKPSQQKVIDTMKKYEIEYGPNQRIIEIAAQLASYYIGKKDIPQALNALKLTYNLTLDEDVKKLILQMDPKAAMLRPKSE